MAGRKAVSSVPLTVGTNWLKDKLHKGLQNIRVLDASWNFDNTGKQEYLQSHIPGAVHFDLNKCVKPLPTIPRNLPEPTCFQEYARGLGINSDSHVVIYDSGPVLFSTKTWWIFKVFGHQKVSVLDGGLPKWKLDGLDLNTGETKHRNKAGNVDISMDNSLLTSYDRMVEHVKDKTAHILDSRLAANFRGEEPEPSAISIKALSGMNQSVDVSMLRGHMVGAVSVDNSNFLDPQTNCFRSKNELLQVFNKHGIDFSKPLVTSCYIGHKASLPVFAAWLCGHTNVALYYGSWTEFSQRAPKDLVECSK